MLSYDLHERVTLSGRSATHELLSPAGHQAVKWAVVIHPYMCVRMCERDCVAILIFASVNVADELFHHVFVSLPVYDCACLR